MPIILKYTYKFLINSLVTEECYDYKVARYRIPVTGNWLLVTGNWQPVTGNSPLRI
jgi:hypothetical protein